MEKEEIEEILDSKVYQDFQEIKVKLVNVVFLD
jgi:hypothetical protein